MEFQYANLWNSLRTSSACQPCNDIVVFVFKADYRTMKAGGNPF